MDGRWVAAVRDAEGRRRKRYAPTRNEAVALLAELRRDVAADKPAIARNVTTGQLLVAWLDGKRPNLAPTSYIRYEVLIRLHLAGLARVPLVQLTPEHVRSHIRALLDEEQSPSSIRQAIRILGSALALAVNDRAIERNVAKGVEVPKRKRRELRVFNEVEAKAFRAAAVGDIEAGGDPLCALWNVLVGTGIRRGEATGLRWSDVDLVKREIRITGAVVHQPRAVRGDGLRLQRVDPKTDAGWRTIPLTRFATDALLAHPQDAIYVFHRGNGKPLNPSTVDRAFKALLVRAKLEPMRIHDLRHTFATIALGRGASLDDLKRWLGHESITTTSDTYGHMVVERARALADAMEAAMG